MQLRLSLAFTGIGCEGVKKINGFLQVAAGEVGDFTWAEVQKVNLKEELLIYLKNGEIRAIILTQLDFMKRHACRFCGTIMPRNLPTSPSAASARPRAGPRSSFVQRWGGRSWPMPGGYEFYTYRENPTLMPQTMDKVLE